MEVWESTLMRIADTDPIDGVKPVIKVTATPGKLHIFSTADF